MMGIRCATYGIVYFGKILSIEEIVERGKKRKGRVDAVEEDE
jgi:hypothetical protein